MDINSLSLSLALLNSEDYLALNDEQRRDFAARLRFYADIAEAAVEASMARDADLLELIDDIELDALSSISAFGDASTGVSQYVVHSSWTEECDRRAMAHYVSQDAVELLCTSSTGLTASPAEVKVWLRRWAEVLQSILKGIESVPSFTAAVTNLIVVDALVSCCLVFVATVRLGGKI